MKNSLLNICQSLLEELQIAMLPIHHQAALVKSMLQWTKSTYELSLNHHPPKAWMLILDGTWIQNSQIEHLSSLKNSVQELSPTMKKIESQIPLLKTHKAIYSAMRTFHKSYIDLPIIEPEMQLLSLNHNLFENRELLPNLLQYIASLEDLGKKVAELKGLVMQEILFSIQEEPLSPEFS